MSRRVRAKRGSCMAFLNQVVKSPAVSVCIHWPFAVSREGYGWMKFKNKSANAHRVSLHLATGVSMNTPMHACHMPRICHNRLCVNPTHLYWGTRSENLKDRIADGTSNIGERCVTRKLTAEEVLEIYSSSLPNTQIAKYFNVADTTVCSIKKGRSWRELTGHTTKFEGKNHGSLNGSAKLDEDKARKIFHDNRIYREIASDFGVSRSAVALIKNKKAWLKIHAEQVIK